MKSKSEMTRWDWVKYDTIRASLEINGGVKSKAAKFLGLSARSMTNYFDDHPELRGYLCRKSRIVSDSNIDRINRGPRSKVADDPNECHEKRPIGWVPRWYKDKYPSLFKD